MHLHSAKTLEACGDPDGGAAIEIADHAAWGGDPAMAARARIAAARRCLRVFANHQAETLARRGMPHAEAMPLEAAALGERSGETPAVVLEAQGMLRLHAGDLDAAAPLLHRARAVAQRDGERLGEFGALEYLVVLELQRGRLQEALRLSEEMVAIGQRLREGSEAPFARAIHALACLSVGEAVAPGTMHEALDALRQQDAKHRLAFVLNRAAHLALERGEADLAEARAREACATARALERGSEVIIALATLARIAGARGDAQELRRCHAEIGRYDLAPASAQARRAAAELRRARDADARAAQLTQSQGAR